MGGGGTVIIRQAIKQALSDPLVHGSLPDHLQSEVDPILAKDVNAWSPAEHQTAAHIFNWAAQHC